MTLYVVRRKNDRRYHCMGDKFCNDIRKAKLYLSHKTAIRHYYSTNGEYDGLEVLEIKINEGSSTTITDELYKKYNNIDYEAYLKKLKKEGMKNDSKSN